MWCPRLARGNANSEFQSLSNTDPSWLCNASVFRALGGECWEITRPTPAVFVKYSPDQLEVPKERNTSHNSHEKAFPKHFSGRVLSFSSGVQTITYIITIKYNYMHNVLLTNIGYLISHHVFVVVDSGVWNISLVPHRHNIHFLKSKIKN